MNNAIVWAYWGHEPSYHLKRMHSRPSIFTLGEWADEWLNRLRTEEFIQKAAADGINTIYTNFYKGFGIDHEKEEIEKTKKLVEIAHKYNIKVLGYCQLDSIYYETFLGEEPNAILMAAKNKDGTPKMWGEDSYYRWSICYNSSEFLSYIKKVIDYGIDYVKIDGFHFDNSYIAECYCENCKNNFKSYLKKTVPNPKQIIGISTFDYIEIPYFQKTPVINFDPLYFLWQKYRQEKCAEVLNEIFRYVKEKTENKALVLHNPAFPRSSLDYIRYGYNPELNSKYCDFVFAENSDNLIEKDSGIITQIMAYKLGERFGYKVFESSWRENENIDTGILSDTVTYPKTYFHIAYYLSQSMIFGGLVGTPWLMRSLHKGNEMVYDLPLQREIHQKVISYFKTNYQLYGQKSLNQVKVLFFGDNLIGMCASGLGHLKDVVNRIHNANIPFSFIVKEDIPKLNSREIIVVPELFFTDSLVQDYLQKASENGCRVVVLGEYNVCNVFGKAREKSFGVSNAETFIRLNFTDEWEKEIKQFVDIKTNISCPDIVTEMSENENGEILIHLLNTKDRGIIDFEVEICGIENIKSIRSYSFEDMCFSANGNVIKIQNFRTMGTLKINKI